MSTKLISILAILTTVCSLALVAIQVLEFMYYKAEPSVWPLVH